MKNLLQRFLLWALGDKFTALAAKVTKASVQASFANRISQEARSTASDARVIADAAYTNANVARRRAKAITTMDVPIRKDHGVVTITAVVRGQTIVHAYTIPPMDFERFRHLKESLECSFGAVDFIDAPRGLERMLRRVPKEF